MVFDDALADRLRASVTEQLKAHEDTKGGHSADVVGERKMFGGLCITVNSHMVGGLHGESMGSHFMARVGEHNFEAAMKLPHARPMEKPMKGFVCFDSKASKQHLAKPIRMAIEYALSLPPKEAKEKKGKKPEETDKKKGKPKQKVAAKRGVSKASTKPAASAKVKKEKKSGETEEKKVKPKQKAATKRETSKASTKPAASAKAAPSTKGSGSRGAAPSPATTKKRTMSQSGDASKEKRRR